MLGHLSYLAYVAEAHRHDELLAATDDRDLWDWDDDSDDPDDSDEPDEDPPN